MAEDEDRPAKKVAHQIGAPLDTLSVHEFDVQIAVLEAEIERLKAAKAVKKAALDAAGSVFKTG